MQPTVLLVDDDLGMLRMVETWLDGQGFTVLTANDGAQALDLFQERDPDVVISDLIMPGMNGIELLRRLRTLNPGLPVILVTSYGSIPSAVEAVRAGADDYLTKPIHPDELNIVVQRALKQSNLQREVNRLRSEMDDRFSFERIVTRSKPMGKVLSLAQRVAERDLTVLLQGESGCGKELLARAIHQASPRAANPFVPVDCGALSANLLESELFGHVRGAFSGAVRSRKGLFVEADGGTLFLDEIGNMTMDLQVKLLRVLQEREVKAVGSESVRKVDVRIVAASNASLSQAVDRGAFRSDLYYRVAVVTLSLPPLRERPEDISALCDHFVRRAGEPQGPEKQVTEAALDKMMSYAWPGNVRELQNAVQRGIMLSSGREIDVEHLPPELLTRQPEGDLFEVAAEKRQALERESVLAALEQAAGNRSKAAKILKISRSSLYNRIRQLKIDG